MENWLGIAVGVATIFGVVVSTVQAVVAEWSRRRRTPSGQTCINPVFAANGRVLDVELVFVGAGTTWNVLVAPVDGAVPLNAATRVFMDADSEPLVARFAVHSQRVRIVIVQKPADYSPVGKIQLLTFKNGKVTENKGWVFSWFTRLRLRRIINELDRGFVSVE